MSPARIAGRDGSAIIAVAGVTKRYGDHLALDDVHLSVPPGGVYGLVGPNGAGKTTLLSIVAGLRRPDTGSVQLGVPVGRMAVVADVPGFEPWLRAREVLALTRTLAGAPPSAASVSTALERVGLGDAGDRRVDGFSRGMTQRLGLATALVTGAALVVLDEPVSALDPAGRMEVLRLLVELGRQQTVVFSSHILADVERVADRIGILDHGRVRYEGPLQDLLHTRAQPRWRVRSEAQAQVLVALQAQGWVLAAAPLGVDEVDVRTRTIADGERGLVAVLGAAGIPVRAIQPVAPDLESVFLELTGAVANKGDGR